MAQKLILDLTHSRFRGKVFVFSGILPIAGNDDGLATILGHEIGHNILHHFGEKVSRSLAIIGPLAFLFTFVFDVTYSLPAVLLKYAYDLPGDRSQEVRLSDTSSRLDIVNLLTGKFEL